MTLPLRDLFLTGFVLFVVGAKEFGVGRIGENTVGFSA